MRKLGLLLFLAGCSASFGQTISVTEHEVPAKPDRLELDGRMGDGEWTGALSLPLSWEIQPGYNSPAPLATEGFVFRDGEALYVAFRCAFDPSDFRANLNRRDAAWDDDFVGIALDVYGDTRNMVFLGSNAYGVQLDVRKNDPANHMDDQMDVSYDVEFEAQAARNKDYYTVELRIPFNTLQFGSSKRQRWKFTFFRQTYFKGVQVNTQSNPQYREIFCADCQFAHSLILDGIKPKLRRQIIPYAFASALGQPGEAITPGAKVGGSAFVGLSAASSVEVALNPDFSNVEADVAQVSVNSSFALFYPERRPFFIEGSDQFATRQTYVYTRSIANPLGLTKFTNQGQKYRSYVLTGYDAASPYLVPGRNFSAYGTSGANWSTIARIQRRLPYSSGIGLLATQRTYFEGGSGSLAAADVNLRISDALRFKAELAFSDTREAVADWITGGEDFKGRTAALDGERYRGMALYAGLIRQSKHWTLRADVMGQSPTFRAEMGFEPQNDWMRYELGGSYNAFPNKKVVKTWGVYNEATQFRYFDGSVRQTNHLAWGWIQWGGNLRTSFFNRIKFEESFKGQRFTNFGRRGITTNWRPSQSFTLGVEWNFGQSIAYNEEDLRLGRDQNVSVTAQFQFAGQLRWNHMLTHATMHEVDGSGLIYRGYIYRSGLEWSMTRATELRLVAQWDDFSSQLLLQPVLTYRPNAFTLVYAGGQSVDGTWQGFVKGQWALGS